MDTETLNASTPTLTVAEFRELLQEYRSNNPNALEPTSSEGYVRGTAALPILKQADGRPIKCSWTVQKPLASTLPGCPLKNWKRKSLPLKPSTTRASESTSSTLDLQWRTADSTLTDAALFGASNIVLKGGRCAATRAPLLPHPHLL